jgi:hypothetical protein
MYVEVITLQGATSAETGTDNAALIIARTSTYEAPDPDNPILEATTLSELEAQGVTESTGGLGWRAAKSFFAGNGAMPRAAKLYFYPWTGTGTTTSQEKELCLGTIPSTDGLFNAPASPVSLTNVYIDWDGDGTYIEQPIASWTPTEVATGIFSGEFTLDDAEDALTTGPGGYSITTRGDDEFAARLTDLGSATYPDAKVYADFDTSVLSDVLRKCRELDVIHWMLAYDETTVAQAGLTDMVNGHYTSTGGSWLLDQIIASQETLVCKQAGKDRIYYFGLPKEAEPTATIPGELRTGIASTRYDELANVAGHNRIAAFSHKVLDANGEPVNNVAATMMGMQAGQFPLSNDLTLLSVPISQITFPLPTTAEKWERAGINVIIEDAAHYPGENLLGSDLTLGGSGLDAYVEFQVCSIKIKKELIAAMLDMIRGKKAKIDRNGCMYKNSIITSIMERMRDQNVCDGLASQLKDKVDPIVDPLLAKYNKATPTAADIAYMSYYETRKMFADTQINWKFRGNVNKLRVVMNAVVA